MSFNKSGCIVKLEDEEISQSEKYTEYCLGQVEKELEGLGLSNADFNMLIAEIYELRKHLEKKPVIEKPRVTNHFSEIERLIYENSRLEDEIAELQRREEDIITRKWW